MKRTIIFPVYLILLLAACVPLSEPDRRYSSALPTPVATHEWSRVEFRVGGEPVPYESAKAGTWQLDNIYIGEDSLAGDLTITPSQVQNLPPTFEDFLILQIQGQYVWLPYGDYKSILFQKVSLSPQESVGKSVLFKIQVDFPPPARLLQQSATEQLLLQSLQVTFQWIRLNSVGNDGSMAYYGAEIACPVNDGNSSCQAHLLDQVPPVLTGLLNTEIQTDLMTDITEWVHTYSRLPTTTPIPTRNPADYPPPETEDPRRFYPAPETSTPAP